MRGGTGVAAIKEAAGPASLGRQVGRRRRRLRPRMKVGCRRFSLFSLCPWLGINDRLAETRRERGMTLLSAPRRAAPRLASPRLAPRRSKRSGQKTRSDTRGWNSARATATGCCRRATAATASTAASGSCSPLAATSHRCQAWPGLVSLPFRYDRAPLPALPT